MEGQLANSEQRGGLWKFKVTFPPKVEDIFSEGTKPARSSSPGLQ